MTAFRPDLVIQSAEGNPIALVEVANPHYLSRDVATEIHRSIMKRGLPRHVPYFLLLSQDKGYLWKDLNDENQDTPPNYEFSMNNVVSRYAAEKPNRRIYTEVLEFLVLQWLTTLADSEQNGGEEPENILSLSGFNDSIKGATVLFGKAG